MMRLNLVLLLAVLASALYLVSVQYESRRLFGDLDHANSDARRLEVEKERLEVEKRAQATPMRVEKLAKDKLQMRGTSPAITQYVSYAAGQPQAAAAAGTPQAANSAKGVVR